MSYCTHCGHSLSPRALVCPICGEPQTNATPAYPMPVPAPRKSRVLAVLLCLFLGGLGAHHLYLRHYALGLAYAVLAIGGAAMNYPAATLLVALACFFDLIRLLCVSGSYYERRAAA